MELFLNAFWLAIALASVALWRLKCRQTGADRASRRAALLSGISLGCALFLLFPVISMTDDLHAAPAIAEEGRSSRRALQTCKGSQADPDPDRQHHLFTVTQVSVLISPAGAVILRLVPSDVPVPEASPVEHLHGRAPPVSYL